MPIVHQDHGFDFTIKPEDKDPPKVHVTGAGGKYLLVRIGVPETELPHIDKYEKVDQDEVNWVFDTINDYQENFLIAWKRIHGGEWETPLPGPYFQSKNTFQFLDYPDFVYSKVTFQCTPTPPPLNLP